MLVTQDTDAGASAADIEAGRNDAASIPEPVSPDASSSEDGSNDCPDESPNASVRFPWFGVRDFRADRCTQALPDYTDSYDVSDEEVRQLERRFPELERLVQEEHAELCLHDYVRQYLGLIVDGRRTIFLNALHSDHVYTDWRSEPVGLCDGGMHVWSVLFDVEAGRFSDLELGASSAR